MRKKKYKSKETPEEEYGLIDFSEETEDIESFDDENLFIRDDHDVEDEKIEEDEEEPVEIKQKTKTTKPDKKKFYVDPKEFDTEIKNYYNTGVISNILADMISKISHKLSFAGNFINYSYREEMVGDGIVRMMKALLARKYDHTKANNPFSYFTKIAFNAFRNRIKKEKHIHEAHEKYQEHFDLLSSNYNTITKNKNSRIQPTRS
jgi:hypothetical protein